MKRYLVAIPRESSTQTIDMATRALRTPVCLASDVEEVLRKIMAAASGVSEFHTKEFHRECLNSVRTIAWQALEGK